MACVHTARADGGRRAIAGDTAVGPAVRRVDRGDRVPRLTATPTSRSTRPSAATAAPVSASSPAQPTCSCPRPTAGSCSTTSSASNAARATSAAFPTRPRGRAGAGGPRSRIAYVPAAAVIARVAAITAVGGFDPAFRAGEDVDLVWRLVRSGWRVRYEPSVSVLHTPRRSWRALARQRAVYGASAAALARRHGGAVAPVRTSPWTLGVWGLVVAGQPLAARPRRGHRRRPGAQAARRAARRFATAGRHRSRLRRADPRRRRASLLAAPRLVAASRSRRAGW